MFPSSVKFILSGRWIFFDKKRLTVFQKRLLSVMFFSFRLAKWSFLDFRRNETNLFLCLQNSFRFSSLLFCKKRFLNLLLVMIALEISLLMKGYGLWLDCIYHFFSRACLSKISGQIVENASNFFHLEAVLVYYVMP